MKFLSLICWMLSVQYCFAQFNLTALTVKSIPKNIQYKGKFLKAVRWADKAGDHIVITTETGETNSSTGEADARDAAIYAYHYTANNDGWKQTWQLYDYVKECPVDIEAKFIDQTFAITDLDKDGHAETWLMYKTSCLCDVSPADLKVIMYESDKKHAMRGRSKIKLTPNQYEGGEYRYDDAFANAPDVFMKYATQLWKQHVLETWE